MIPTIPGVPWWGAVLIAFTFAAVGFAFDAGSGGKELTMAFAAAYVVGCVTAVLIVRQAGVFTAVIQPPLILFITVPGAYFLFHGGNVDGFKEIAINCGYPLIERFPLMFFTSAIVLLIGMLRWYQGMSTRRAAPAEIADAAKPESRLSAVMSKISGLLTGDSDKNDAVEAPAPRRARQHSLDRGAKAPRKSAAGAARTRGARPVKRAQPSRSRHTRPPETEIIEPVVEGERPRRPRPTRRTTDPTVPPAEPRRRPRTSAAREPRKQPPPSERRSSYPPPKRHSRFDGFEPFEPNGSEGTNGSGARNGSHHPISRVRYRGGDDADQHPQYRARPRTSKHRADAWEYDV